MAGTLFGLGLSVQYDASGIIAPGALLYVYDQNSSTPVTTYADFGLTVANPWPIEADGSGRLPQIWVPDGSYRARLTTAVGVTIFDELSITAIGASSGGSSGTGSSIDSSTIFATGDMLWLAYSGTRSGWVRCNGRTMGNAASGGTERANSDTASLFSYMWTNYSNTLCPVSGGRGGSAAADYAANKTITLLDMRGRAGFGLDDMGNTTAGVIVGSSGAGAGSGAETVTLTTANLPSYNLSLASLTVATTASYGWDTKNLSTSGSADISIIKSTTGSAYTQSISGAGTVGGTLPSGGGGSATNKMPPYRLGTWYIKC